MCYNSLVVEFYELSDASGIYWTGTYCIRTIDKHDEIFLKLLCAKRKFTTIKPFTILKLELGKALISAKCTNKVINSLG